MRVIYGGILKCKPLHEAMLMCLEETQSVTKLWLILCALDFREGIWFPFPLNGERPLTVSFLSILIIFP